MSELPDIIPDGLPDHLPEGEQLLWQGRPDWKRLALNAFHVRKVGIYFGAIILAQAVWKLANGATFADAMQVAPKIAGLGCLACAILVASAYATARTTHYTLTSKRVLMKVGIALPVIINLPLRQIDGVSFAATGKDCGTVCFKTGGNVRLAYMLLWPHAMPWQFMKPKPAFRDIPQVEEVASRLAMILGGQMPVLETQPSMPHGSMVPAE